MENLLEVQNLNIYFGDKPVVDHLSFVLSAGKTLAIVGESGSGKSMTALSLLGLLPKAARIEVEQMAFKTPERIFQLQENTNKDWQQIRGKAIGMIFQEPMTSLNPLQRCGQQIDEVLKQHLGLSTSQARERSMQWLQKVKIQDYQRIYRAYPHEISGGQKQRVMIAMAMCCNPSLLLADEPTTALDATVQKDILLLMRELQQEFNTAILFISHDLSLVANFADEVMVMQFGRLIEQGSSATIFEQPQEAYTKALLNCRPPLDRRVARLATIDDFQEKEADSGKEEIPLVPAPEVPDEILLEVKGLSTWFPVRKSWFGQTKSWVKAVQDVSFNIRAGHTLGLVGESGSGKTTLGRSILRLIEPTAGSIRFADQEVEKMDAEALRQLRRDIQIVFQDPYSSLNPRLPVGLAITEPMQVHSIGSSERERVERCIALLEQVGLQADHFQRFPHEFSGGQRQRLCIARALAVQPRFLVCDEAVSSLDVSVQATVLNLLKDLQAKEGLTYLFISHDLAVVRFMCDDVMVMKDGVMVEKGSAEQVFEQPAHPYTQALLAASR